jgi:hypothetical protein
MLSVGCMSFEMASIDRRFSRIARLVDWFDSIHSIHSERVDDGYELSSGTATCNAYIIKF